MQDKALTRPLQSINVTIDDFDALWTYSDDAAFNTNGEGHGFCRAPCLCSSIDMPCSDTYQIHRAMKQPLHSSGIAPLISHQTHLPMSIYHSSVVE